MAFDKESFWERSLVINPPLTDEMVAVATSTLGVVLPQALIALLKVHNGGATRRFVYARGKFAKNPLSIDEMNGIDPYRKNKIGYNILESAYFAEEWGLPPRQLLLTGDGHWWITLDYRVNNGPQVKFFVPGGELRERFVAPTFDEFLNGLVPLSEFASRK